MEKTCLADDALARATRTRLSYQAALSKYKTRHGLARISWVTWLLFIGTLLLWCVTAYQMALISGAHTLTAILTTIANNAVNVQDADSNALTTVLITYGAKDNDLIMQGQYWRFLAPIFLHANALHVGLNMLNLLALGTLLERLIGHLRFLFIYIITGVISVIASFYFAPQEISVGASGAIFGLVGVYSLFVLLHRRAFRYGGLPSLLWIAFVIAINLSIGLFVQNVDNYAHVGGLLSGCLLGWAFAPLYRPSLHGLIDINSLSRRWPLALLTILGTLVLAIIAVFLIGTKTSL